MPLHSTCDIFQLHFTSHSYPNTKLCAFEHEMSLPEMSYSQFFSGNSCSFSKTILMSSPLSSILWFPSDCRFLLGIPKNQCPCCYYNSFYLCVMVYVFTTLQIIWPLTGQKLCVSFLGQIHNWWKEYICSLYDESGVYSHHKEKHTKM